MPGVTPDDRDGAGEMRIALVHPFSWPEVWRGAERYLHDLAWYLSRAGHRVDVVTATSGQPETAVCDGVTFHRYAHKLHPLLHRARLHPVDTFGGLALAHLARRRYDLVHALTPTAAIAGRLTGHTTVYTSIGASDRAAFRATPWSWTFFRNAVRAATVCTALSHAAAGLLTSLTGRSAVVLPPGVREDQFALNDQPRQGPPRILFCSDASEVRKGLDVLLAAFAGLLTRFPDARLQLAGPGDPTWALGRLGAATAGVVERVDRFPPDDRAGLLELYRQATVTALPSSHEAFGLVLVESLASGTPVVCSDVGGPREIVCDGVGVVARHGDAAALAEAIERAVALAGHPQTPARCALRARRWDWLTAVGPAHEALYGAVRERGRRAEVGQVWNGGAEGAAQPARRGSSAAVGRGGAGS